jgi:ferrochelatase
VTTGFLLINLGTPNSPSVKDVRAYLKEFLFDPYVIDINPIARWCLLNFIILPTRPKKSAHAYQSIWTEAGSPLLVNSTLLAEEAQTLLGNDYKVALGMRYGNPSIESAIEQLKECDRLIVMPLFPQYSLAATETAIQQALRWSKKYWAIDQVKIIREFYQHRNFIEAQATLIKKALEQHTVQKIIFSYHGLPERQIKGLAPEDCYKTQCYQTTELLIKELGWGDSYITTFQSRLGRTPWIKPYTDEVLIELAAQGIKNIAIVCPSFICDCLETLEEIGMRAREQWAELGGETFILVPCLNQSGAGIVL